MPSDKGRCSGSGWASANVASRQEQEKIESEPTRQEERYGNAGDEESATRAVPEGCRGGIGIDRRGDVLG
jgi:hypothetical protein